MPQRGPAHGWTGCRSGRCDFNVAQLDWCAAADRVGDLRDRIDMGDKFVKLFAGGLACDLDVIGDISKDRRVAVEPAPDADSDPGPAAAGVGRAVDDQRIWASATDRGDPTVRVAKLDLEAHQKRSSPERRVTSTCSVLRRRRGRRGRLASASTRG